MAPRPARPSRPGRPGQGPSGTPAPGNSRVADFFRENIDAGECKCFVSLDDDGHSPMLTFVSYDGKRLECVVDDAGTLEPKH